MECSDNIETILRECGQEQYLTVFVKEKIDFDCFLRLGFDDLRRLIPYYGPAKKIAEAIDSAREKQSSESFSLTDKRFLFSKKQAKFMSLPYEVPSLKVDLDDLESGDISEADRTTIVKAIADDLAQYFPVSPCSFILNHVLVELIRKYPSLREKDNFEWVRISESTLSF